MFEIDMKYLNGKIYKLVSNVTNDVYYGSTIETLKRRLQCHKKAYTRYMKGKRGYVTVFKIIETGDYDIHLVEEYACLCRSQLESIERVYVENYTCINKHIPTRTINEWSIAYYKKNKDHVLQKNKKWRDQNKEYIKEYHRQKYIRNIDKIRKRDSQKFDCECGGRYQRCSKARHMKSKKHQSYLN
jgi:hypothetical protein